MLDQYWCPLCKIIDKLSWNTNYNHWLVSQTWTLKENTWVKEKCIVCHTMQHCSSWIPRKCKLFAKSQYCLVFLSNCTFEPIKVIFLFPINPHHYFRGTMTYTSLLIFFRKENGTFFSFSWNLAQFTYVPVTIFWVYVSHV